MQSNSRYEPNAPEQKAFPKETRAGLAQRFFFGDDVFVSYARHDSDYALALADELTRRGLSCFLDQWGTPPGEELPPELVERLYKSTMLVVVGSRQAAASENVMKEVMEFKNTKRPIIPITFVDEKAFQRIRLDEAPENLKGTLEEATWYGEIAGIARTLESDAKLKPGGLNVKTVEPSPQVITRIVNAKGFMSRSKRLRRAFWTMSASLLALLIAAGAIALMLITQANQQVQQARVEQAAAETKAGQAEETRRAAEQARDDAIRARVDADTARTLAEGNTRKAQDELQQASADLLAANTKTQAEQVRAEKAGAEADRQTKNAVARQAGSRADALLVQAGRRDRDWAGMFQESVLLSIESARRLSGLGMASADSAQPLRHSLSLLPRAVRAGAYEHNIEDALLAPGGEYLITRDDQHILRVRDASNDRQISKEIRLDGEGVKIAFNPDRTMAATQMSGKLTAWDLPQGSLRWERERRDSHDFLTFSPDGKYLAASDVAPAPDGNVEGFKSVVVWDAGSGQKITEVRYADELKGVTLRPAHHQLAISLEKTVGRSDDSAEKEHLIQLWDFKNAAAPVVSSGAREAVYDLTFSPDGRLLATSSRGGATIWEVGEGRLTPVKVIEIAPGHTEYIQKIDFGPDGKTIGTWGRDGMMQTWDVLTGRMIWRSGTRDADDWDYFKPYVMLRDGDGLRAVDVRTGREVARVIQSEDVRGIDYTPEGDRLLVYHKKQVRLYDTGSAEEESRLSHRGPGRLAAFTPDRRYAAVVSGHHVAVWDLIRAREVARLSAAGKVVYPYLSPDGSRLAAWCDDNAIYIWKVGGEPEVWRLPDVEVNDIVSLTFSPRGRYLAFETTDEDDKVLDVVRRREVAEGDSASFSADESYVIMRRDRQAQVYDLRTGSEVVTMPLPSAFDGIEPVAFSPDGGRVVRWQAGALVISEINGSRKEFELTMPGNVYKYAFSPDGKYLVAVGGMDAEVIQIWEAATGRPAAPLLAPGTPVSSFLFSPDSKYFFTDTPSEHRRGGDISVRALDGGREVACAPYEGPLHTVVFSLDGRYVVVSGGDESARVLHLGTGQMVAELGHEGPVRGVTFSPDGRLITTNGGDGTARVWQVGEWREVSRVMHDGVMSATFSADGRRLATVGGDLTARLWVLPEYELIERACRSLRRNFSREEWQHNFPGETFGATCAGLPPGSSEVQGSDGDCHAMAAAPAKLLAGKR